MSQNTSHAVMAQRKEPPDSLDFFPTPPWATRALCEWLIANGCSLSNKTAWEPACGEGHMVRPMSEYFQFVLSTDVHDYGFGDVCDFLFPNDYSESDWDWLIFNPPFRLAELFIQRALSIATEGVAVLVRTAFLESEGRHRKLFSKNPPSAVVQFSERVIMSKGICRDPSIPFWDERAGKWRKPSTATAYCWIVWDHRSDGPTRFDWIAPCRRKLERPGDYAAIRFDEVAA